MRPISRGLLAAWLHAYGQPAGPVVEIGSFQVEPVVDDLRPLFGHRQYIGVDCVPGPGVDVIADGSALPIPDGVAGLGVCVDTLEHAPAPDAVLRDLYRVLEPGGYLFVVTVFCFQIHHEPDYWRFTPTGLESLLTGIGATSIQSFQHGVPSLPTTVAAVARKGAAIPDARFVMEVPA